MKAERDRISDLSPLRVQGERSQWEFEEDFKEQSRSIDWCLFELPWSTWPLWRIGIELRRLVQQGNFPISVLSRLSKHYCEGFDEVDFSQELLPIPLIILAAEADVDNAMQELLDPDTPEDIKISLTGQCRSYGTKSWLYLVIVTLNYLHTSRCTGM